MSPLLAPTIYSVDSGKPGKHVVVMTGVHGNEKVGPMTLETLRSIELSAGKVTFIVANPSALEKNTRYLYVNLNRRFGKGLNEYPEDALARNIEVVLDSADALLDIHSYNEEMDRPFIITDKAGALVARELPVEYITTGWSAFDAGSSESYMTMQGKLGMVFECGSSYRPEQYIELASACVRGFLFSLGLCEAGEGAKVTQQYIEVYELVQKRYPHMNFSRSFTTFDRLEEGEVFAENGSKQFTASVDDVILFPRPMARLGDEIFIRGRLIAP